MTTRVRKTPKKMAVERGKRIISAITAFLILTEVASLLVRLSAGQGIPLVSIIRFAATVVLCALMYEGHQWARDLLAFGASVGTLIGAYTVYLAIASPHPIFLMPVIFLVITILSGISAYLLVFSGDVGEFFASRRA